MTPIAERVLAGDVRAIARSLRRVDDRVPGYVELLKELYPHTGRAIVVGVTGNPGAGKSTLCDRLIEATRAEGKRVAVLAVDPSSPFTGGAILGDRIRMQRHAEDPLVFIRSVATRGYLGGLSRSARDMVRVLDAGGFDIIFVETVGVGQDELDITRTAHTTVVVMAPGLGDEVQAIKAGLMESADVFAVNKADREGADSTVRDLELMLALGGDSILALSKLKGHRTHSVLDGHVSPDAGSLERWVPPIVRCVSTRGEGATALLAAVAKHGQWARDSALGRSRRLERVSEELRQTLREALSDAAWSRLSASIETRVRDLEARIVDPYTAVEGLVAEFRNG